ncbi:methyltransferase domain-containing protein [Candidatus Thioglobus sp.]|nr:methyltransferase domain-containing protein [Candidatus Thioglobus sp.]
MYFSQTFNFDIKKNSKVLEIGYGNGSFIEYFHKKGNSVYGTEVNDVLLKRGKRAGYKVFSGWVCDIKELDQIQFELIALLDVAEHLNLNQLEELFLWASNHLSDDGILCLRFPEGSSPLGLSYQNGDFTHINSLTKTKIAFLCHQSDLKLYSYKDDLLSSNKLCSLGFLGKVILKVMQIYSYVIKLILKIVFFPLAGNINLATNSIALIKK